MKIQPATLYGALALFVLGSATGCSASVEAQTDEPTASAQVEFATHPPQIARPDMANNGTLLVEDLCVYLKDESGKKVLPIFEVDAVRWSGDSLVYEGVSYRDGDKIRLTGSYSEKLPRDATVPPQCEQPGRFVIA
ncbi:hypothetical protein J4H92_01680 [Leucobacter weissii]|uniref:C-type lysozyme inhibitor domain-containing protein n=1 Tax=Leucobacter weissii TaxID=1983706 RepID=A0A939S763_9MICO|nr:hypothetical protein [Leucobacter weissii]MBO1900656.1 hypothetical protein [Leucobacter weissii]